MAPRPRPAARDSKQGATKRPSKLERALPAILKRLAAGESLRSILPDKGRDPKFPTRSTFMAAVVANTPAGISDRYARAREAGAWEMAEEILEIADDGSNDTTRDKDGNERLDTEWIARSKLRVDARKFLLSKLVPRTFGDKLDLTSGGDPLRPGVVEVPALVRPSE
jgi:hypothetical protein